MPLEHLAEYTDRLTRVFEKHGTRGTWYAHASVGCLHVRPVLDMQRTGAHHMRAIAEEAFAMVKEYKGSHSGEHGDGLVRSEYQSRCSAPASRARSTRSRTRSTRRAVQSRQDRRAAEDGRPRAVPLQAGLPHRAARDGARLVGAGGARGSRSAAEMCNNNGALPQVRRGDHVPVLPRDTRRAAPDARPREHSAPRAVGPARRGRAGLRGDLRHAGPVRVLQGLQARMPDRRRHGEHENRVPAPLHEASRPHAARPLVAHLPRYAPHAARLAPLLNLRNRVPALAALGERVLGFGARRTAGLVADARSRRRAPPLGRRRPRGRAARRHVQSLFRAGKRARRRAGLTRAGYRVTAASRVVGRPLCCGRTFLGAGLVDEARKEARRMLDALAPAVAAGIPIVGLEPACLLTLRDEFPAMLPGPETQALAARAQLFEEFVAAERAAGRFNSARADAGAHARCCTATVTRRRSARQRGAEALRLIPELKVETFDSSCCGMAGSFGLEAEHYDFR